MRLSEGQMAKRQKGRKKIAGIRGEQRVFTPVSTTCLDLSLRGKVEEFISDDVNLEKSEFK